MKLSSQRLKGYRIVLATTKENINAVPTLFRTYDQTTAFHGCAIWEVARATSAATSFFKSIKCGRDHIEFIDAALGFNNPCEELIEEARKQFPGVPMSQYRIVSIGTGLGDVVTIKDTRTSILRALKTISTTSKKVSDRLDARYGETNWYYRFNVDRGLEDVTLADWKMTSKISAHTHNYLQEKQRYLISCAKSLCHMGHEIEEQGSDGDDQGATNVNNRPDKTKVSVEHQHQLSIRRNMTSQNAQQRNAISHLRPYTSAEISSNSSTDGSKQWNSIGA